MVAPAPFLHVLTLIFALAARLAAAVSISFGQWDSAPDSQAMAAQMAMSTVQARQSRGSRAIPASSGENCAQGKHLPEFYLLGAKNTATSSLWMDLKDRGVISAPGVSHPRGLKEWVFFLVYNDLPAAEKQAMWLESLPDCGVMPAVMGDFSVVNLFTIPLPSDFAWSQDLGFAAKGNHPETFDTAKLIRQFHGEAGGKMPKFVVFLREPLARLQSEYYHTLPLENCMACMANGTFADSLATTVALLQHHPPLMSDWFWKSFYSRQIEEYLKYFDAEHFFFAPNKQYFAVDPPKFSADLLEWLHIPGSPWHEAAHDNSHEHPELDKELPPTAPARKAYEAFMAPENERLARTLAQAHTRGAVLAGYTGRPGDIAAVQDWLAQNW